MANIFDVPLYNSIVNPRTPAIGIETLNQIPPMEDDLPYAPEYGEGFLMNTTLPYEQFLLTPKIDMGAMGITPQLAQNIPTTFSSLPPNLGAATQADEETEEPNKLRGILDLLAGIAIPGYNFIKGALNKPQSYQQFSPGTSIRNGIVSIDGVNTPYGAFGGDFYDSNTGLNRFDRARNRFNKTGSMKDLFGSSRTLKEFLENRKKIKEQKTLATDRNRRLEKDIQTKMMDGESLSDIGKSMFTGPGKAFEQQSGGVTGKGTANERNYGGR